MNGHASSPTRFFGSKRQPPQWSLIVLMYAPPDVYGLVARIPPSACWLIPTTFGTITQS